MADWTVETRPVFGLQFNVVKGVVNPNDAQQLLNQVHIQVVQGDQPWKTGGIQIQVCNDNAHGAVNETVMTDGNGQAVYTYAPDAFPGFVFITAAALPQNMTENKLVTANGIRIES